ncbi:MAG: pyridoxamine 5'-phosphate oxidase family protein [Xanthomonadales bacterium]|nr:pyridoxamine 5'-phosphate oxidase family protein [Xanthomonadales bacterium]NIN58829.1 pyridoxamine 5'-phosphate oxidase family protein [Xanthomonadales bacterium]NIN74097.1 pyridoxamine 5'-phosphate oxidase family protein [Xanthomonadales bacterium]NIO14630.1 pyridoxamine 5'-phosphate oxidase family protein [Xanthomonadales bacterium]NIP11222.1 pyridoxamine 5'-phosphate oxidase family protein [Xanthomonadales bacterium]
MSRVRESSAWSLQEIESFLDTCVIPVRLACITNSGAPVVCSLWYQYGDGALWCATQKTARVARYLQNHPLCGFEVAPDPLPYRGVRGQGRVTLSEARGPEVLAQLIDRYLGDGDSQFARWLMARASNEVAIRIVPTWLTSWDFAARMGGARADG